MSNSDNPIIINASDAIQHPAFDPHLRDLVLAINERVGAVTIGEIAEVMGFDPHDLARGIIAQTIAAEVVRIFSIEEGERGSLN